PSLHHLRLLALATGPLLCAWGCARGYVETFGNTGGQGGTGSGPSSSVTIVSSASNSSASSGGCDFQCGDGQCLAASQVCDSIFDCLDGSDEAPVNASCGGSSCATGEFACNDG